MHESLQALAPVGAELSGRVGDRVFTRNQHGSYSYLWASRVDPNTVNQQRARSWFASASTMWRSLPPAWRVEWATYAANLQRSIPAKRSCGISGFNFFVGTTMLQAFIYIPGHNRAPTTFTLGRLGPPAYAHLAGSFIVATFDPTDDWLQHANAGFALFTSPPQPVTVNYYKGPFRYAGSVTGGLPGPPYQALFRPAWFPTPTPCHVWVRGRSIETDGRLSPSLVTPVYFP